MQLSAAAAAAAVAAVAAAAVALFQLQSERNYRYNARCLRERASSEKKLPESVPERERSAPRILTCVSSRTARAFSSALRSPLCFNSPKDCLPAHFHRRARKFGRKRKREIPRKRKIRTRRENAIVRKRILSLVAYLMRASPETRCVVICKAITFSRARARARTHDFLCDSRPSVQLTLPSATAARSMSARNRDQPGSRRAIFHRLSL